MGIVGNVQLVAGDRQTVQEILKLLKKEEGIDPVGNPDVYIREYASFGIDEARELAQKAGLRPVTAARRTFVITTPGMTSDAQNALLKTFEETPGDALFFLVVPSPQTLLPTLRSRAQLLALRAPESVSASWKAELSTIDPRRFLDAQPQKRLDMLKPLLDKGEDDKRDLAGSIEFLAALERELSNHPKADREGLRAVYRARKYITDKGSLQKALLEQVALLI